MKKLTKLKLYELFNRVIGSELNYDNVEDFYAYLGYTLELERDLQELGINGTSDLLDYLKGDDE